MHIVRRLFEELKRIMGTSFVCLINVVAAQFGVYNHYWI